MSDRPLTDNATNLLVRRNRELTILNTIAGALNPRNSMFAAVSMISVVPPLILAAIFQRYITGLNIVDPVTVGHD